jgi:hypothetical protein
MHTKMKTLSLLIACACWAGCVEDAATSGTDGGPDDSKLPTGEILPWKVGNNWKYKVTDKGEVSDKLTTIEAEEAVGGTGPHKDEMAYKVVTLKADGTDQTISWQAPMDDKVVRYREQSFTATGGDVKLEEHWDPYKLHVDGSAERLAEKTWLEEYTETKLPMVGMSTSAEVHDRWAVDQPDATVTVPAGTFEHCIVYTKAGGGDQKMYWYLRGVGKIKETGGQTEELESYEVKP